MARRTQPAYRPMPPMPKEPCHQFFPAAERRGAEWKAGSRFITKGYCMECGAKLNADGTVESREELVRDALRFRKLASAFQVWEEHGKMWSDFGVDVEVFAKHGMDATLDIIADALPDPQ